jgi:hypothetical protein
MALTLKLNNIIIEARKSDKFINATQICKAGGKQFAQWKLLESTKELVDTLQKTLQNELPKASYKTLKNNLKHRDEDLKKLDVGIPTSQNIQLIDVKRGKSKEFKQGTWIHPDLAVSLAQWVSPSFAIQVSRWVRELFITGNVSIDSNKTNEDLVYLELQIKEKDIQLQLKDLEHRKELELIEETIKLKDKEMKKQSDNQFWYDIIVKNKCSLKKYEDIIDGVYNGSFEDRPRASSFNEKIGLSIDSSGRATSLSTGSDCNNPFILETHNVHKGLQDTAETYLHSLLEPFHIKLADINKTKAKDKKGSKEHFMLYKKWTSLFIDIILECQKIFVKMINDKLSILEKNNRNFEDSIVGFDNLCIEQKAILSKVRRILISEKPNNLCEQLPLEEIQELDNFINEISNSSLIEELKDNLSDNDEPDKELKLDEKDEKDEKELKLDEKEPKNKPEEKWLSREDMIQKIREQIKLKKFTGESKELKLCSKAKGGCNKKKSVYEFEITRLNNILPICIECKNKQSKKCSGLCKLSLASSEFEIDKNRKRYVKCITCMVPNLIDGTKLCNECFLYKKKTLFEKNSHGTLTQACSNCFNNHMQKCSGKCSETKLVSNFSIKDQIRSRICNNCLNEEKIIYKKCRGKCKKLKPNTEYDRYSNGTIKNECKICCDNTL